MTSLLRPVEAVECPVNSRLVSVDECETCMNGIEIRRPWRHFVVKCDIGDKSEGVYQ